MLKADDGGLSQALVKLGVNQNVATTFVAVNSIDPAIQAAMTARENAATVALAQNLPADLDPAIKTAIIARAGAIGGGTTTTTTGGGGDGPGNTPPTPPTPPPLDWSSYLANWGFEAGDIAELDKIFKTYTDPAQASAAGLAYIRGTAWYAKTFAGIGAGIKAGLFSDEAGYRSYVNDLNQVYGRFYNRSVTGNEVVDFLNAGTNPNAVNAHLTGQAAVQAQLPDIQYQLGAFDSQGRATDSEVSAYGDTLGGLSNLIGPQLQARLDKARQKYQTIFQGNLATPSLSMVMGRPAATSFGTDISKPDVSA